MEKTFVRLDRFSDLVPMQDKIVFKLKASDWHSNASETVWAEYRSSGIYQIRNVPFYVRGVSVNDLVSVETTDEGLQFNAVVQASGHSTYRVFILNKEYFFKFWSPLEELNCSFEVATKSLLAIDVPASTDIRKVYDLLEHGVKAQVWDFEEGHCGHKIQT